MQKETRKLLAIGLMILSSFPYAISFMGIFLWVQKNPRCIICFIVGIIGFTMGWVLLLFNAEKKFKCIFIALLIVVFITLLMFLFLKVMF